MSTVEVINGDTQISIVPEGDDSGVVVMSSADITTAIESGEQGPPGPAGAPGAPSNVPGPAGADGNTILYGLADPTSADGVYGNFYINTSTHVLFGPKTTTWPAGTSLIGPQGNPGADGNTILYGSSDPTAGLGVNGNFFINTATHFMFGPKAGGAWPAGTSLIGPTGPQGPAGAPGSGGSTVLVADTAPTGQPDNSLWWESDSGLLYIRYNDGTSTQWVIACPQPDISTFALKTDLAPAIAASAVRYDAAQSLTAPQHQQARQNIYAAPINALAYNGLQINGSFDVNQVGINSSNGFFCDGWRVTGVGGAVVIASASATGLFPGLPVFCNVQVSTAQPTMAAGDYWIVYQMIEGYRIARLAWGTPAAQPLTIAFWSAHHRPGIYTGTVKNGAANDTCAFTYTQAAADTPQYNVVTIPGAPSQPWPTDNTVALGIYFALACGTTYSAAGTGIWQVGANYIAGPGQVNAVAATSDVFRLSGVMVLPGNEAPSAVRHPFIMRPYDQEVTLCKRYYNSFPNVVMSGNSLNAVYTYISFFYPQMRTTPTVAFTNMVNTNSGGPALLVAAPNSLYLSMQNFGAAAFYSTFDMALDARI